MKAAAPPMRNGVGASCVSLPAGPWPLLLDFLAQTMAHVSRAEWLQRMNQGLVFDGNAQVLGPQQPYQAHSKAYYYRQLADEPAIPFQEHILFQDEHLVVVDKPHFLPVTPSGNYLQETVLVRLKRKLGLDSLTPIHRIDRDTAGLVLFSIQPASRDAYHGLFRQHAVDKSYEAIAPWRSDLIFPSSRHSRIVPAQHFMLQREEAGTPNALTHMSLLEVRGSWARYRLQPVTGKRHQLRVHMNSLRLPIAGDGLYPQLTPPGTNYARPLQLLAKSIAFTDPITRKARNFESQRKLSFDSLAY